MAELPGIRDELRHDPGHLGAPPPGLRVDREGRSSVPLLERSVAPVRHLRAFSDRPAGGVPAARRWKSRREPVYGHVPRHFTRLRGALAARLDQAARGRCQPLAKTRGAADHPPVPLRHAALPGRVRSLVRVGRLEHRSVPRARGVLRAVALARQEVAGYLRNSAAAFSSAFCIVSHADLMPPCNCSAAAPLVARISWNRWRATSRFARSALMRS